MLVLSRKVGELVKIGDGEQAIWLKVVYINHRQGAVRVGLGIQAPRDIRISRPQGDIGEQGNHHE